MTDLEVQTLPNASAFARPNVTSLSHDERYRPSAWPCKRVERKKKGENDDTRTSKIAEKINYNNSNNSTANILHRPIYTVVLYITRPLINIR